MNIYLEMYSLLMSRLSSMPDAPDIKNTNMNDYTPKIGIDYIEPFLIFGDTSPDSLGDNENAFDETQVIFQIDVYVQKGNGSIGYYSIVDKLSEHFKIDLELSGVNVRGRVNKMSVVNWQGDKNDGWYSGKLRIYITIFSKRR